MPQSQLEQDPERLRLMAQRTAQPQPQPESTQDVIDRALSQRSAGFETQISEAKQSAQAAQTQRISESKRAFEQLLGTGEADLKRMALFSGSGTQIAPRQLASWRRQNLGVFEQAVESDTAEFTRNLADWEMGQRSSFETSQQEVGAEALQRAKVLLGLDEAESKKQVTAAQAAFGRSEKQLSNEAVAAQAAFGRSEKMPVWVRRSKPPSTGTTVTTTTYTYPPEKLKSFSETIMETPEYFPEALRPLETGLRATIVPFGAAVIGDVESFVYGIGGLLGLSTPSLPPTLSGGLVRSGIESATGGQLKQSEELSQTIGKGPAYLLGSAVGEYVLGMALGKALSPVTSRVGKVIEPVTSKLDEAIIGPIKDVLPSWKGSDPELWLIKHSDWYEKTVGKGLPRGFVGELDLPVSRLLPEDVMRAVPEGGLFADFSKVPAMKITNPALAAKLEEWGGMGGVWDMLSTPKTTGVMVAKEAAKTVVTPVMWDVRGLVRGIGMDILPSALSSRPPDFKALTTSGIMGYDTGLESLMGVVTREIKPGLITLPYVPTALTGLSRTSALAGREVASAMLGLGAVRATFPIGQAPKPGVSSISRTFQIPEISAAQSQRQAQETIQVAMGLTAQQTRQVTTQYTQSRTSMDLPSVLGFTSPVLRPAAPPRQGDLPSRQAARQRAVNQILFGATEFRYPVRSVKSAYEYALGFPEKGRRVLRTQRGIPWPSPIPIKVRHKTVVTNSRRGGETRNGRSGARSSASRTQQVSKRNSGGKRARRG